MNADFDNDQPNYGKLILALVFLVVALVLYFVWRYTEIKTPTTVAIPAPAVVVPVEQPAPEPEPEPEPEVVQPRPVETTQSEPDPLPNMDKSDEFMLTNLAQLPLGDAVVKLLVPDNLLLKSVRAVMALDEGNVVHDYRPIQSPAPAFKVTKIAEPLDIDIGQRYTLSPENYARYRPWVEVLARVDKAQLASLYQRIYPWLQEAYYQQGVDRGGFHNVVLEVIDKLLAAPVLEQELVLVQPKVFYQFEDPALEKAPATHRLLWRMGPNNTRSIQQSLLELKQALAALDIPKEAN